jgi:hypothetical protein
MNTTGIVIVDQRTERSSAQALEGVHYIARITGDRELFAFSVRSVRRAFKRKRAEGTDARGPCCFSCQRM